MPRRFPGTANGSMTADCDVTGSSPVRGAKTALAFAGAVSYTASDNPYKHLYSNIPR